MSNGTHHVTLPFGNSTITVGVQTPNRTARMKLKLATAKLQGELGVAFGSVPEGVEALRVVGSDLTQLQEYLSSLSATDPSAVLRTAPIFAQLEACQESYAICAFQAIGDLKPLSNEETRAIMSQEDSEFWTNVEDLQPLVDAVDFFRLQSTPGLQEGSTTDGGVANISEAEGARNKAPKKSRQE